MSEVMTYPKMKDSLIKGIGEIPFTWKITRIHNLFFEVSDKYNETQDGYMPLLSVSEYYGVAERSEKIDQDMILVRAATLEGYKKCQEGDIVSNIMLAWKCALGRSPKAGLVSPAYCVYRPREGVNSRYYHYLFRTSSYGDIFHVNSSGLIDSRLRLYSPKFYVIQAPVPPTKEQELIAEYLDAECVKIDKTIAEAKCSIDEYKLWKESIIYETVTKGLNHDVEMVDTDIFWIGAIPKHWKLEKLKRYTSMLTPMRDKPEHLDGDIPWIRIEDFDGKYIATSKEGLGVSQKTVSAMNLKVYPVGTILCTSSCDLGKCAIVSRELVSNQRFIGIIPNENVHPDFLYYLMLSNAKRLNYLSTGSIQANLSRVAFEQLLVQIPPFDEQREIASFLDEKISQADALINEKISLISDLESYKKSLIYEVVTGKRKVV